MARRANTAPKAPRAPKASGAPKAPAAPEAPPAPSAPSAPSAPAAPESTSAPSAPAAPPAAGAHLVSHVQPGTAQHLLVDRFISDSDTTISRIMLNGKFECFGLEDEFRAEKVVNETRIPAGLYTIGLRTIGKHHDKYRTQFPDIHEGMLHILDVEGFEYILIHCGNTDDDTSGCLLVGTDATTQPGNMSISSSRAAYRKLYAKVIAAARAGDLTIEFVDNDR